MALRPVNSALASHHLTTDALLGVAPYEPGMIINEHCSHDEYVKKRVHFLSHHRDYGHVRGLFRIARQSASEVFRSEDEVVSVQEIRRRELVEEVVPLLPFPTTLNMKTLDDFGGYPSEEWHAGMTTPERRAPTSGDSRSDRPASGGSSLQLPPSESSNTSHGPCDEPSDLSLLLNERAVESAFLSASKDSTPTTGTRPASATNQPSGIPEQLADGKQSDSERSIAPAVAQQTSRSAYPPSTTSSPYQEQSRSPPKATPDEATLSIHQASVPPGNHHRDSGRSKGPCVDSPPASTAPSSPAVQAGAANPTVGSLACRGMRVPVKGQKRKRPAATDDNSGSNYSSHSGASSSDEDEPAPAAKKPKTATLKATSKALPPRPRSTFKRGAGTLHAIAAGTLLPQTRLQARRAAEQRRLDLAARRGVELLPNNHPPHEAAVDMFPEFFTRAAFPARAEENETVRCVCRRPSDASAAAGLTVACDACGVWQHVGCVGEAVPRDLERGRYECHRCDPWAHRRLLARLRRANPD